MPVKDLVSISLLCYNSLGYLPKTLSAIQKQTYSSIELIIVDNCSTDDTPEYLRKNCYSSQLILNDINTGYCKGHNQAIQRSKGEFILILNPDVLMTPTFIEEMVDAIKKTNCVGIVSGKLLRIGQYFEDSHRDTVSIIDSTGLSWTPNGRHWDRGTGEIDHGQFDLMSFVFGASGAATLYRREMLDQIAFEGQFFDEDYYFGHEDVDLCWRAQIAGWKALYTPFAKAYHVRFSRPDNYAEMPKWVRIHSMKNRFMLRIKNMPILHLIILSIPILGWDILVLGYTFLYQPYAFKGLWEFIKLIPRNLHKRKFIMKSRKVSLSYLIHWFSWKDDTKPFYI